MKKTITITTQEILEHYVSLSEDCTISEAREIIKKAEIFYDIKESGNHDKGTYEQILKEIKITYEQSIH